MSPRPTWNGRGTNGPCSFSGMSTPRLGTTPLPSAATPLPPASVTRFVITLLEKGMKAKKPKGFRAFGALAKMLVQVTKGEVAKPKPKKRAKKK